MAKQGQRGIAGQKGERGLPGIAGPPGTHGLAGKDAVKLKSWKLDRKRYTATPIMSDGTQGPELELRGLFEQFQQETDG